MVTILLMGHKSGFSESVGVKRESFSELSLYSITYYLFIGSGNLY